VDGQGYQTVGTDQTAPYEVQWDTRQFANGDHNIHAEAYDAAGNHGFAGIRVTVANEGSDTDAPGQVADLAAGSPTSSSLRLTWTAVGDDGRTGRASQYDIRYSLQPITYSTWQSAVQVSGEPVPQSAGQAESFTVMGLQSSTMYYFALDVADEEGNRSGLSVVASASTSEPGTVEPGFVMIPAGTFTMGSPTTEQGRWRDESQHQVTLTRALHVCDHEVTQAEWESIMHWNDSGFHGPNKPVEQVTWYDCLKYCNERSVTEGLTPVYSFTTTSTDGNHITGATVGEPNWDGDGYRLLTEAEWEYACRATSTTRFHTGNCLAANEANCNGDYPQGDCPTGENRGTTIDVKQFAQNIWSLYDTHGNVWEWCWDLREYDHDYPPGAVTDPRGADSGPVRVIRGGGWDNDAPDCRSAVRSMSEPHWRSSEAGLRVARVAQ
jgi:formylglycine-generating enzyme required for sulfatase activity